MSEPEWTELANDIRVVDGNHDLGAGALAAALTERGWTKREAREAAAGEALPCDAEVADDEGEHHCSLSPGHKPGDGGRHYSFIPADNHWCEGRTGHSDLPFGHWFRTARAREIAAGLAEIGTGGTPAFIRGYNAGFDDAWAQKAEDAPQYTPGGLRYPTLDELNGGPPRTDLPMVRHSEDHAAPPLVAGEHAWMQREQDRWPFCRWCGIVRRADDKNKPCRGVVHVGLRDHAAPLNVDLLARAMRIVHAPMGQIADWPTIAASYAREYAALASSEPTP